MKTADWDSSLYEDRHSFVWKTGGDVLELLAPRSGERILDLGCGTGHLTAKLAEAGAIAAGIDSSPSMIAQARQNFPRLHFALADARTFHVDEPFDAVFSNAALHWIRQAEAVVARVVEALKPGGRFVLEMGGRGNIARIQGALEATLRERGIAAESPWYYPSVAEYCGILERSGFEVRFAAIIPRWTKLEHPERGLREWLEMFAQPYLMNVPSAQSKDVFEEMERRLLPVLRCDGHWWADYRRLRVSAVLQQAPTIPEQGW